MSTYEILIGLVSLASFIWVTYDVWTKTALSTGTKVIWTIAAFFLSILTAIVYYFIQYRKRATA